MEFKVNINGFVNKIINYLIINKRRNVSSEL
jgi:hypothetical protein